MIIPSTEPSEKPQATLPLVSPFWQDGFHRFLKPFLRRHFHTIAAVRGSREALRSVPPDQPLIVYGNHPSWWDPLIAHVLCRQWLAPRQFYAPIDADALENYRIFSKLGFFGVRLDSTSGAAAFLRTSHALMATPNASLWLTPEGRFADVRDATAPLAPGLSHLCWRSSRGLAVPLALEYVYWEERLPECLIRFGEPCWIGEHDWSKAEWHDQLTFRLRANQAELAKLVIARDSQPFEPLLSSGGGAGAVYDFFRRLRSWLSARRFRAAHGEKFN